MKKNYQFLICCFLFLLLTNVAFGQKNYKVGSIETLNGEVIEGFINYKNWLTNPKTIEFKKRVNSKIKTYTPSTIKQFRVVDELYQSATVKVEISPRNIARLSESKNPVFKEETLFLQSLIKGEKNLLYYRDKNGDHHFFIYQDSAYQLLVYKKYLKKKLTENNTHSYREFVFEYKEYIYQLSQYFKECISIEPLLLEVKYEKKNLVKIFKKYYNCVERELEIEKKTEKGQKKFGLLVGVTRTVLKFNAEPSFLSNPTVNRLDRLSFSPSINFSGSLFLNYRLPRNLKKWSWNNEFSIHVYNVKAKEDNVYSPTNYTYNTFGFNMGYVKLSTMGQHTFSMTGEGIYAKIGISTSFAINNTNYWTKEDVFNANVTFQERVILTNPKNFELGGIIGIGIKFKGFLLETRQEFGNGVSNILGLSSRTQKISLLIGYSF